MKKVLGIIASPRKLGNSEIFIKEISRNIPEQHELALLRLSDYKIRPCKACYQCLYGDEGCNVNDDYYKIVRAAAEADGIIVAAPTYFLGANAQLKMLLDRGLAAYSFIDQLWDKPSIGIGVTGIKNLEGQTLLDVRRFLMLTFSNIKGIGIVYGALPGEVFLNDGNKEYAAELGKSLFGEKMPGSQNQCPVCGSTFVQLLDGNKVKCALCSNVGEVNFNNGKPELKISDNHKIFFTKEDALKHKEWLKSMKTEFLSRRKEILGVCLSYRDEGKWMLPEK